MGLEISELRVAVVELQFMVYSFALGNSDLNFRVWSIGFRIQGLGV